MSQRPPFPPEEFPICNALLDELSTATDWQEIVRITRALLNIRAVAEVVRQQAIAGLRQQAPQQPRPQQPRQPQRGPGPQFSFAPPFVPPQQQTQPQAQGYGPPEGQQFIPEAPPQAGEDPFAY